MAVLTMKFGGTSVGSAEAIAQAAAIVIQHAQEGNAVAVVVSAMSGVTDALIKGARTAAAGDARTYQSIAADVRVKHYRAIDALLDQGGERAAMLAMVDSYVDEFATFCRSIHVLGEVTPRAMDTISSLGERMTARIMAALLRQRGVKSEAIDSTELIVTDDQFQNAAPKLDATRERVAHRIKPLLADGCVPVITGFMGATESGATTTLGRGGSDYSAAILGAAMDADEVWTWTDVDGVMTADPRYVPDARVVPIMSFNEVAELAYFGAKVLHPRTIRPCIDANIPLWVKNTFNPTYPGTKIVREPECTPSAIKSVTNIKGLSMVTVQGHGFMGVPGIAARTFSAVASQGASVLMISQASSEQSISFVIPTDTVPPVIAAVEKEMAVELARGDIDRVWSMDNVVIVSAVGSGMRTTPGVAARIFGALAKGNVNVIGIAQGSSECSISLVIAADDAANAVNLIHREVILNGSSS